MQWAEALPPGASRNQALQSVVSSWAVNTPEAAAAYVQNLPAGGARNDLFNSVVNLWASSDASAALQGGQVDLMIAASPTALGAIRSGKALPLAVSSVARSPALPDVPTATEAGVDYVVSNWFGWAVPRGTPKAAIDSLRDDVVRAMAAPDVREKLAAQGAEPSSFTPEQFAAFLKDETHRWTEVIRSNGIRVEQ